MMKHWTRHIVTVLMISLLLFSATGFTEPAAANPLAEASGGLEAYCPEDGTLFGRIIMCLEETVIETTIMFMEEFYPSVRRVVFAVLTLVVCIYGTMMAIGAVERVARDSMTFLLKFGGVVYFMEDAVDIYLEFVEMLMGTLAEIGNATTFSKELHCPQEADADGATTESMWERADCIFDMVIGLSSNAAMNGATGGGYEGLERGLMGFFYYNLQSGALGILIGLVGLYICFNLVLSLLRASYTYLVALIMMSFLFIIGILFVPLLMFRNGYTYFERWTKMVLAMIIQPLVLFAYLNLLLTAFDLMLYSGENSLMRIIAGDAVDDPDFNIHEYAETEGLYTTNTQGFTHDLDQTDLELAPITDDANQTGLFGDGKFTDLKPNYDNFAQVPVHWEFQVTDDTNFASGDGNAGLAGATLLVGLASYIMLSFMKDIPSLAQDLSGGVHQTPGVIAGENSGLQLPFSRQVNQIGTGFNNTVNRQFHNLVGTRRG